jgi:hypothetical protein
LAPVKIVLRVKMTERSLVFLVVPACGRMEWTELRGWKE